MSLNPRKSKLVDNIHLIASICSIAMLAAGIFNWIFPNTPILDLLAHIVPIPVWVIILVISSSFVFLIRYGSRLSQTSVIPKESRTGPNLLRYQDVISLKHHKSGYLLYTHNVAYTHQGTSGQFQVGAIPTSDPNNKDRWIIKTQHASKDEKKNQPVSDGDMIRLENLITRRNLHSHYAVAPLTATQLEVTAYGQDGIGDTNDNWKISLTDDGRPIKKEDTVRLIHVSTNTALHSNPGMSHQMYTAGLQEVTSNNARDENDYWLIIDPAT